MAVYNNISDLPLFNKAVLTAGTFDGVHRGHWAILQEVVAHAKEAGGESVLITFDPHPRKLLFPDQPLGIITPLQQKIDLILDRGIDHVVVVPFTRAFAGLSASEYIEQFLVRLFRPHSIVIGYDHRFGQDRKGGLELLQKYAADNHYKVTEIPAQLIDAASVSSTRIRKSLTEGCVEDAAHMLGRLYSVAGTVVHGNKLGRTIGYPTANLEPADKEQLIPGRGIYAVKAVCDGETYGAMLSIGFNPTVTDKKELKIEANIFDFDQDIYGRQIAIQFVRKLRDEQKFESLEALKQQLHQDKTDTLEVLAAL